MDFMFTDDQLTLRKRVRTFAEEKLEPIAHIVDETDDIPWDLVKMLNEEGYLRVMVPEAYGGEGEVSCVKISIIREELSRVSSAADGLFTMQGLGSYPITVYGTEAHV